jgi:hypothetical protein
MLFTFLKFIVRFGFELRLRQREGKFREERHGITNKEQGTGRITNKEQGSMKFDGYALV